MVKQTLLDHSHKLRSRYVKIKFIAHVPDSIMFYLRSLVYEAFTCIVHQVSFSTLLCGLPCQIGEELGSTKQNAQPLLPLSSFHKQPPNPSHAPRGGGGGVVLVWDSASIHGQGQVGGRLSSFPRWLGSVISKNNMYYPRYQPRCHRPRYHLR